MTKARCYLPACQLCPLLLHTLIAMKPFSVSPLETTAPWGRSRWHPMVFSVPLCSDTEIRCPSMPCPPAAALYQLRVSTEL